MGGRRWIGGVGALLGALLAQGCSIQQLAADEMTPILVQTKDQFNREPIPRYARESGPALLAFIEGIGLASPENEELLLLQAEMNATFAFAFLEQEDPDWATATYQKAESKALAALAQEDDALADELTSLALPALTARLEQTDEDALPALFWWGFAAGAEINLHRDDPARVAGLDRVDAVMEWVCQRQPGFFHAGPHLYLALRNVALPATLGGDPERGLQHFQEVDRITGGRLLISPVLRAQFYAPTLAATKAGASLDEVKAAQRRAWDAWYGTLKQVVETPVDIWPEQTLPNAVARQRALRLLADPEGNNIIPPPDAHNEYAAGDEAGWGDAGDGGAWDDGD